MVVMVFVLGLCVWLGVQVMMPFALMLMPVGGLTSPYPVMVEWIFDSVAVLVTVSNVSSLTFVCAMTGSTGATFTSTTTTVKLLVALNGGVPLSVTLTTTVFVEGLCVWAGIQVTMPVAGLMLMPPGAETRPKVKVCAGVSILVAVLVAVRRVSSLTD